MGRHRAIPKPREQWQVFTNPVGQWLVLDQDGAEPFRHPDRIVRLHALYLAAQAPDLRVAVAELMRTVEYLQGPFHHFTPLLEFAHMTITLAKPPEGIIYQVAPFRNQGELDLEAA